VRRSALDKAAFPIRLSSDRLVLLLGRKVMLNSKICRQHAAKCIETAESIPPGAQREMFFDMAKRWTDLAINIESSEALADLTSPANDPRKPYRFGSGIVKAPIS